METLRKRQECKLLQMWQLEHEWNLYGELFCCQAKLLNMQISIEMTRFLPEQFRRATVNVTIALVISEWITVLHLFTPCSVVFSWNTSQISVNAAPKNTIFTSHLMCVAMRWSESEEWRPIFRIWWAIWLPGVSSWGFGDLLKGLHLSRGIEGGRERWSFTPPPETRSLNLLVTSTTL